METLAPPAGRRTRRGRPPTLTEEQVAEAALLLLDRVGVGRLTMRGLAHELGVPVMTLYGYVPNKRALFDMITDHVLRPVAIPPPDAGSWDERMRVLQRATRAAVGRHPGLRDATTVGHSVEAARLADGVMGILRDGGFEPDQAELAFATLFTFMLGQIELDAIVASMAAEERTIAHTSALGRDGTFEAAFDVILEGLAVRLRRP